MTLHDLRNHLLILFVLRFCENVAVKLFCHSKNNIQQNTQIDLKKKKHAICFSRINIRMA